MLKTAVLMSAAFGLGSIGLGYVVAPQWMYGLYGITLDSVNEANMVRSAYGGVFVAVAVLFFMGALRATLEKAALIALLTFMSGFAVGRIVSVCVDGVPSWLVLSLIALEVCYAALAMWLLKQAD